MKTEEVFNQIESREQISKIIANEIEKAILEKKILPGEKLPSENELCKQFNVSRTSVREAISVLSAHGIVNVEKGRGVFVKNLSSEIVSETIKKFFNHRLDGDYGLDLVHARQIIEPGIAYYAAKNRTEEDIELLREAIELHKRDDVSVEDYTKADLKFHLQLAIASQNQLMPLILKPIYRLMPNFKHAVMKKVENARQSAIELHTGILEAVINQDQELAKKRMREHLEIAEKHLKLSRD